MIKPKKIEETQEDTTHRDRYSMVRKSNDLIQRYRADLNSPQFKITMYLIAKAYTFDENSEYTFDIQDFCRCCGLDDDSGGNYKRLKEEIKKLKDKSLWYEVYGNPDIEVTMSIINKAWIYKKSGKIKLRIDDDMKPYILKLKESWELQGIPYTQFALLYTLPMKSRYSIRLYELLKSWEKAGTHYWDIEELKKLLNAETYERTADFNRKVLKVAQSEINELTDITISYEFEKEERSFKFVHFTIKPKEVDERLKVDEVIFTQLDGQLGLDEFLKG